MKEFYPRYARNGGLEKKSALTVAGPFCPCPRIYKSVLPEEEYDDILRHVYESRGMIEPFPSSRRRKRRVQYIEFNSNSLTCP